MDVYDAIVVGAGIEGSSTAYHIANKGVKKVALLEQVSHYFLHDSRDNDLCSSSWVTLGAAHTARQE